MLETLVVLFVVIFVAYLFLKALYPRGELAPVSGQRYRSLDERPAPSHPMLRHLLEGNQAISDHTRESGLPVLRNDAASAGLPSDSYRQRSSVNNVGASVANSNAPRQQRLPQCVICLDKEKDILLKPCRHFCVCSRCAPLLLECPVCRLPIEDREKIYDS